MKIYMAESGGMIKAYISPKLITKFEGIPELKDWKPYILESYYYIDDDFCKLIPYLGDFLLDSGAFTFMTNSHKANIDWDEYVEKYAKFIKDYKVKKYFELDIDCIVGYEEVLRLRKKLESLVGWKCIPVWHINRGKEEYIKMCKEYDYVALGGLVSNEYSSKYYKYFDWFIKTAHENGAKIHCLGFTALKELKKYHFDSVDSTAWTTGNRFGHIYKYENGDVKKIEKPAGTRIKANKTAVNNFVEWIKYQIYADKYL